jgi:hypothetical protein
MEKGGGRALLVTFLLEQLCRQLLKVCVCVCVCVWVRLDIILKIFQLRTNISLLLYVCVCVYVYLGYCRVLKQLFWGYHPLLWVFMKDKNLWQWLMFRIIVFMTSQHCQVVEWLILLFYIWKVPGSNLCPETSYFGWTFLWFSPVPPGIFWNSTLK